MNSDHPRWLGTSKAAARLGVSEQFIRHLFDRGLIDGHRSTAGQRVIDADSLANYTADYSVSAAAAALGLSAKTVRIWFDAGELAGYRTEGGHRRIDPAAILDILQRQSGTRDHASASDASVTPGL